MSSEGDGTAPMKVDLTEAAKGADVAKAPATGPHRKGDLVEREEPLTIRYVTPTGETKEAEVVSRVMGREDRDRLDRIVASNTGGIPLVCFPENGWRLRSEFRVALQLVEPPKWLLEAVGEDDALLGAIVGVLEAHSLRYFLGDDGEGGPVAIATHVEVRPHSQSLLAALGE